MADKARRLTDEKLEEIEKRLSAIYSRAEKEIQKTIDDYFAKFCRRDEKKLPNIHNIKIRRECWILLAGPTNDKPFNSEKAGRQAE